LDDSPRLLIVGGPNGSGKTTLAIEYSRELGHPYLGADEIAAKLNPANPVAAQTAAARQYIQTLEEYMSQKTSFVCESTLSGLTMRNFIVSARNAGYSVSIAFLLVASADVCVARVAQRVRKGGHNVPESDIRRRFTRSIRNFWRIYRELADNWVLLYNGETAIQDVAAGSRDRIAIRDPHAYSIFLELIEESNDD
jgi:predicted ABC-type ATPase